MIPLVPFCPSKWRNFIKFAAAAKFSLVGNIRLATVVNLFRTEAGRERDGRAEEWEVAEVACTFPRKSLRHYDQLSVT